MVFTRIDYIVIGFICNIHDARVKGLSPHELAHRWVKDLRIHPDTSIKVG